MDKILYNSYKTINYIEFYPCNRVYNKMVMVIKND